MMSTNVATKAPNKLFQNAEGVEVYIVVMAGLSVTLNGILLIALATNMNLVKLRRTAYHIPNLALANSLVGIGTLCYILVEKSEKTSLSALDSVLFVVTLGTELASFSAVCLMTIGQVVATSKPLTWAELFKIRHIILTILVIWLIALASDVVSYLLETETQLASSRIGLFPVCFGSVAFVCVYCWLVMKPEYPFHVRSVMLPDKTSNLVLSLVLVFIVIVLPFMVCFDIFVIISRFYVERNLSWIFIKLSGYLYIVELLNFVANPVPCIRNVREYQRLRPHV